MNRKIRRIGAVRAAIMIAAVLLILLIYPVRAFHYLQGQPTGGSELTQVSKPIDIDHSIIQTFTAQYDRLDSVDVHIDALLGGRYIEARLLSGEGQVLYRKFFDLQGEELPGKVRIPVKQDLTVGDSYLFMLYNDTSAYTVGYTGEDPSGQSAFGALYYQDTTVEHARLLADFNYALPLGKLTSLFLIAGTLALTAVLILASFLIEKKSERPSREITVQRAVQFVCNPLAALVFLTAALLVFPGRAFDDRLPDILLYEAGIFLTAGFVFYAINHRYPEADKTQGADHLSRSSLIRFGLMAVLIAVLINCAIGYMNGTADIFHTVSEREMMAALLGLMILTISFKEIRRIPYLTYLVIGLASVIYFICTHWLSSDQKEYALGNQITVLTGLTAFLAGLVVLNLIYVLIGRLLDNRKKCPFRISIYGILTILVFVTLIVFRNTRMWGIWLALFYGAFYVRYSVFEGRRYWLKILTAGLVLNFLYNFVYCLFYRYFSGFITTRFPFVFHTVTVTAEYMTFMTCMALVLLLTKIRKSMAESGGKRWRRLLADIWLQAAFLGLVSAYAIFTMSRTAYFSILVSGILLFILSLTGLKRGKGRTSLGMAAVVLVSVLLAFPAAFTLQRVTPAMVGHPRYFEVERQSPFLSGGANWDNRYFMSIERFTGLFRNKIFGLPERGYNYPEDRYNFGPDRHHLYDNYGNLKDGESSIGTKSLSKAFAKEIRDLARVRTDEATMPDTRDQEVTLSSYANGRLDIWTYYLSKMNATGHSTMGIQMPDGETVIHAHNTYLQVAYDHGLPLGILFTAWMVCGLVSAFFYYRREREEDGSALLPFGIILGFMMVGLTEWVFQFSNPLTVAFMLVAAPLMIRKRKAGLEKHETGKTAL